MTYFDMSSDDIPDEYAQLAKDAERERGYIFYPIAFVNKQLAAVGSADGFQILQAVRKTLKA